MKLDPTAALEVRMDSRLVIEQMAGRWKVKHADMKPLALEAARLRPATVTWTWVPRELNKVADTLVNRALDGDPVPGNTCSTGPAESDSSLRSQRFAPGTPPYSSSLADGRTCPLAAL